jgi:hypothetical protein
MIFVGDMITMLDQTPTKLSICTLYHGILGIDSLGALHCATYVALLFLFNRLDAVLSLDSGSDRRREKACHSPLCSYLSSRLMHWLNFDSSSWNLAMIRPMQLKCAAKWKLRLLFTWNFVHCRAIPFHLTSGMQRGLVWESQNWVRIQF